MNIPSVIRLIGTVFFLAILPMLSHALTPGQVFDKVKDSVVVVKILDAQGKVKGQGSGVILPFCKVATNCHVVEGGSSYQVGRGKQFVSAILYAEDGDKDICILDAKGDIFDRIALSPKDGDKDPCVLDAKGIEGKPAQLGKAVGLKVGDTVFAVGAPQGLELSLSDGIVAQLRGSPSPIIQTTAAISPGSSGGGLFDKEGQLVGLTTFYIKDGQSLNFAMPVEWISEVKPGRKLVAEGYSQTDWLITAAVHEGLKNWQDMLNWCRKWTKSEPKNALAWFSLGAAYEGLNRDNDAIKAYRQAVRIDPEYVFAWNGLGFVYERIKRYNDAIKAYQQALRINPEYAMAWYNLGIAYQRLKRYNDAIDAYSQAVRINPEYADAWTNLGTTYQPLNRTDDAIEAFRNALQINPEGAKTWYNLGNAYGSLNRYNDAIAAYRQAVRINPEYALAWNNLGIVYAFSGNKTAALDAVRELRRLDPAQADKLFNLIVPR